MKNLILTLLLAGSSTAHADFNSSYIDADCIGKFKRGAIRVVVSTDDEGTSVATTRVNANDPITIFLTSKDLSIKTKTVFWKAESFQLSYSLKVQENGLAKGTLIDRDLSPNPILVNCVISSQAKAAKF